MSLSDAIKADGSLVFISTNDFGESVTYKPMNFHGQAVRSNRSVNAVVIRQAVTVFSQDGDTVVDGYEVHIANSATLGIDAGELDTGGDMLAFPSHNGQSATDHSILRLVTQDEGMLVLECR